MRKDVCERIHFNDWMVKFKVATKGGRIEAVVRHCSKYKALIIDEIGCFLIDKNSSHGLFQLKATCCFVL